MSRIIRAALCASVAVCATPANAAVFTYSFLAEGTGTETTGYSQSGPIFQAITGAAITIAVNILPGDTFDTLLVDGRPAAIAANSTGLAFFDAPTATSYVSFSGRGEACFANPGGVLPTTAGAIAVDPSCGSLSFRQSSPGGRGGNFTGRITSFQITAGGDVDTFTTRFISTIPEPATWAMMLAGFGMVGYAMRRRRVAYA